jgi:hypothetical protein
MSMDIFYYSNYCKHSQKILQTLVKGCLTDKVSCVCIDNRKKDPSTNQTYILLENGSKVIMPPTLHSVPALLLVNDRYRIIFGDEITKHFHPQLINKQSVLSQGQGEPLSFQLNKSSGGTNIVSEAYTFYDAPSDELSAKGNGRSRQMYNYVTTDNDLFSIETPDDNYQPDKVSDHVTIDNLQQKRMDELEVSTNQQKTI